MFTSGGDNNENNNDTGTKSLLSPTHKSATTYVPYTFDAHRGCLQQLRNFVFLGLERRVCDWFRHITSQLSTKHSPKTTHEWLT